MKRLAVLLLLLVVFVPSGSAATDEVTRCRITVTYPKAIAGSVVASIWSEAHVTCRYLPSLSPAWQRTIKVFVTLQRFGSEHDPIPDVDAGAMRSAVSEGDYMAHVRVYHACEYTTVDYWWRARAWAVNYSKRGKRGRSKVVASAYAVGTCF